MFYVYIVVHLVIIIVSAGENDFKGIAAAAARQAI